MSDIHEKLDVRGQSCPMPVVKAAQAIRGLAAGQTLEVLATDPGSVSDFDAWSKSTGNELVDRNEEDGVFRFVLRKVKE